ncbi:hypothetical protein JTB14_035854 [Gonioctena quinquepunctata]|nr:hypothetical protein JTB14_035854 [Gonioctena quinquepunctata]
MVVLEVFKKNIKVRYKSTLISKATFLTLISGFLTYTLPFIFAYKSGGFWLKHDMFFEQPEVNLLGDYLFIATTNNSSNPIVCSTYPFYKRRLDHLDFCTLMKVREIDQNLDGKIDRIIVNFRVNLFNHNIETINLILPLSYKLNDVCPFLMQSAIIFQHSLHQSLANNLQMFADLTIYQTNPIQCDKNKVNNFYNTTIIDVDYDKENSNNFEIESIIEKYFDRNVTTQLTNIFTNIKIENKRAFDLKLSVRYPQHRIFYKPGFWKIIKTAWVQYSAVYIIVAWCSMKVKNYFFSNRLVFYYQDSPLKKNV